MKAKYNGFSPISKFFYIFSLFIFIFLFSTNIKVALATCNSSTCTGQCGGPSWNGSVCQTQGYYCSAGSCVCGWAAGTTSSACAPTPSPIPSCNPNTCKGNITGPYWNGNICMTQGDYCSAGQCVHGWAGGSASTGCPILTPTPTATPTATPTPIGRTCYQCQNNTCIAYSVQGSCSTSCSACSASPSPTPTPIPSPCRWWMFWCKS